MTFVLEMQEYDDTQKTFVHRGYVNVFFTTRIEAATYLEKNKPFHIMSTTNWKSMPDSENIRYVVREYYGEKCDIIPF
jgi:hypothetical protein